MSLNQDDLKIVMQVIVFLENKYMQYHTHSSLANDFFINERKLRTLFKIVTNQTINDFLTQVRISKAREYLSNTDDAIKKIARNVGLDIRSLEKHFKKKYRYDPIGMETAGKFGGHR